MEFTAEEELDNRADEVGVALSEVEWELCQLFGKLNFLDVPEDKQDELEDNLRKLGRVRDLVTIAIELYPYPYGEDRE